ncbi:MAG: DUF58 domain-containing protein [Thermodesulfobacteriota bacterium]
MRLKFPEIISSKIKRKITDLPCEIDKKKVYILPSRPGLIFLSVILVIFVGSFNENNNMGLLFSFFLFSLLILTIKETRNALLHLKINSVNIENSFAGSKAKTEIFLASATEKKENIQIKINSNHTNIDSIDQNSGARAVLFTDTFKRGIYEYPEIIVSSHYPYGIFNSWTYLMPPEKQIVWPKPANRAVSVTQLKNMQEENSKNAIKNKHEDEFKGLREYEKGDSIKRISWKAYSRGMGLLIKDFSTELKNEEVNILWDKINIKDTETKLSVICKTILDLESSDIKYGLKIPGFEIKPSQGLRHKNYCLEILAGFKNE